jgi:hypothetical protein
VFLKKKAQATGHLLLGTVIAVFGPAIVESPLNRTLHPHSAYVIVAREWIESIVLAAALGFLVSRLWKSDMNRLAFVLPSALWLAGFVLGINSGHVVARFSGSQCAKELGGPGCKDFFVFTIPFVRAVAYSAAALIAVSDQEKSEQRSAD